MTQKKENEFFDGKRCVEASCSAYLGAVFVVEFNFDPIQQMLQNYFDGFEISEDEMLKFKMSINRYLFNPKRIQFY